MTNNTSCSEQYKSDIVNREDVVNENIFVNTLNQKKSALLFDKLVCLCLIWNGREGWRVQLDLSLEQLASIAADGAVSWKEYFVPSVDLSVL